MTDIDDLQAEVEAVIASISTSTYLPGAGVSQSLEGVARDAVTALADQLRAGRLGEFRADYLGKRVISQKQRIAALEAENAKLREVLEWVADTGCCNTHRVRALAALADTEASE